MRSSSRLILTLLVAAFATSGALAETSSSQTRSHHHRQAHHKPAHSVRQAQAYPRHGERPPLTVNRRSFLDPGPVVPVGSLNNYVTANTTFNRTPDQTFQRSRFGNENIPAPLQVPGRDAYILRFATPRELGQPAELGEPFGFTDED
ncbi:hypothetical protein [Beijerinckia indica]|uniref:Uncharacterized protein n=1 Tax=Beijerinckia indica subsp. indica (strain ATCC 9039 / DSM 1715 / NCIMB 8712) TaxID=395963 RepID=B2IJ63_BEII9|nr:hypothetical protein [Beijerinckia indica]ACB94826.1 hypothetical protein Bind_1184 [Beijerinckia indica subsp. indica ATCC 9039]